MTRSRTEPRRVKRAGPRSAPPLFERLTTPEPPIWIERWLADDDSDQATESGDDWAITFNDKIAFAQVLCRDAAFLHEAAFESAVESAYHRLAAILREHNTGDPVRFWNYVPTIHARAGGDGDRYMVFNAGRHRALESWYQPATLTPRLVAASAVDHRGGGLIVHALAAHVSARPVENPRQQSAYRYSRRYGAVPPSFARATLIEQPDESPMLLTAGTASVVGEDSRHIDNLTGQLRETEINLAALVASATQPDINTTRIETDDRHRREILAAFNHLRAYVVTAGDEMPVLSWLQRSFPGVQRIEVMPADLCRRELLVEVEGVASLPPPDIDSPTERA